MTEQLMNFFGRFHPLLVHLPIGILILAFLFEALSLMKRYRKLRTAVQPALLVGALSAVASAVTGYFLSLEGGYERATLSYHQNMGIATAAFSVILYFLRKNHWIITLEKRKSIPLRFLIFIPLIGLLTLTGHLGGSLTHGEDFITGFEFYMPEEKTDPVSSIQLIAHTNEAVFYHDVIQPILESKCYACHSSKKQKSDLRLDGKELIRNGGKNGRVIVEGLADSSSLFARLMLPQEDEHHMPPNEKPQPGTVEIDLIRLWIDEGADFEKKVKDFQDPGKVNQLIKLLVESIQQKSWLPIEEVAAASAKSIHTLRDIGVLIMPVAANSNYLSASFINSRSVSKEQLQSLLQVKDQLVSLKLSYSDVRDNDLSVLKNFENLTWLYLDHTNITDSAAVNILPLQRLRHLNLVYTDISDKTLETLSTVKGLEQLFVYQSRITPQGIKKLMEQNSSLTIDTGNYRLPRLASDTVVYKKKS